MKQWVVVESWDGEIFHIFGPFDHEGLANAFAEAYGLQMQSHLIQVFELNKELKHG